VRAALLPPFYEHDSVIASGNSQFGARSAFHLVKRVYAPARARKTGRRIAKNIHFY
jgi:hypothetical protein